MKRFIFSICLLHMGHVLSGRYGYTNDDQAEPLMVITSQEVPKFRMTYDQAQFVTSAHHARVFLPCGLCHKYADEDPEPFQQFQCTTGQWCQMHPSCMSKELKKMNPTVDQLRDVQDSITLSCPCCHKNSHALSTYLQRGPLRSLFARKFQLCGLCGQSCNMTNQIVEQLQCQDGVICQFHSVCLQKHIQDNSYKLPPQCPKCSQTTQQIIQLTATVFAHNEGGQAFLERQYWLAWGQKNQEWLANMMTTEEGRQALEKFKQQYNTNTR